MAAIISCEKIGLKTHHHQKRFKNNRSIKPTGVYSLKSDQHHAKPLPLQNSGIGIDWDHQLRTLDYKARQRYLDIYETLSFARLPDWLDSILEHRFIPTLRRIGVDEPVTKTPFAMALSSWKLLGPLNEKIIAFHPAINAEIEEVRRGLKLKTCYNLAMIPRPQDRSKALISGSLNKDASPENLFELFDGIGTPWIILPRASGFLKKHHCHYLPAYLKTIDRESRESCIRLFSRITVEFLGNYCLKFADRYNPPQKLAKLLFYGYSAMFWKNLRCPPKNLENVAAFDHFFKWIRRLERKSEFLGAEEKKTIDQMRNWKTMIFPAANTPASQNRNQPDSSRFVVTLRHGEMGVATILRYLGFDRFLNTRQTDNRFQDWINQKDAHSLLHAIQTRYKLESKKTQRYMKHFVDHLKSAYALM